MVKKKYKSRKKNEVQCFCSMRLYIPMVSMSNCGASRKQQRDA